MKDTYLKRIISAKVYDVAQQTDLERAQGLSERLGNNIFLKREDQQPIFCYKIRGAYNKMRKLTAAQLAKGVVTASAGNHAQGVALSAKKLGCEAIIVMPTTTPEIKQRAVKSFGAEVVLIGDSYSDASVHAAALVKEQQKTYIPPFDDPDVIAGQGTVAAEIWRQHSGAIDAVFIPIGGGGLAAGMSAYFKALNPEIKIIGVEPIDSNAMGLSIAAGKRIELEEVGIFADGVAVKKVGEETFKLCKEYLDEVITISTDEMCAAIKDIFEDTRSIVEPSGALGVAGIKKWLKANPGEGQNLVTVLTGANLNFDRLRHVAERTAIGEGNEKLIAVTIPEEAGSFQTLFRTLGDLSVTEFNYRYGDEKQASIFVGFNCADPEIVKERLGLLANKGFKPVDLTDNSLAKLHGRYLVGGRAHELTDERIFSFQFPERRGALLDYLEQISGRWNISLFHYRNHGSDFGRVLCGMQVPKETEKQFDEFLTKLGYTYSEQTDNAFNELFLS
ncbi:MAG: threonine dehydratase [Saprospiraceae bacterium]|jgi:threonine dehydratase